MKSQAESNEKLSLSEYLADSSSPTTRSSASAAAEDNPTRAEEWLVASRMAHSAFSQLTVGPLNVLGAGVGSVFGIGLLEAWTQLDPVTKTSSIGKRVWFASRYAVAQILPSLIWHTQPVTSIAQLAKMPLRELANPIPLRQQLRLANLQALRGAIAGSVVLTQVLSLAQVLQSAKQHYQERVLSGREPPLSTSTSTSTSGSGTVLRLAGERSSVTEYSFRQLGRQGLFCIYERPEPSILLPPSRTGTSTTSNSTSTSKFPIYWHIPSGAYSNPLSWKGFTIPTSWLFHSKQGPSLILEADTTRGDGSSLALLDGDGSKLDLDLFGAAQAFYQLSEMRLPKWPVMEMRFPTRKYFVFCWWTTPRQNGRVVEDERQRSNR